MLIFKLLRSRNILRSPDNGEGSGGGGAGDPPQITPEIQKMIDSAVGESVRGLKAKNDELLTKVKDSTEKLKQFEGIDPVKTKEFLKRIENDEEARLISEGKLNEVVDRRTEKLRSDLEKQLKSERETAALAVKRAETFQGRVLDDAIRAAAAKSGLHTHAVEDALFRGRAMFSLDEDGKAVQRGEDGQVVIGKDGKTPFSPSEWLEGMKETAPHWFPTGNNGSGSNGGNSKSGNGKSMSRSQFDSLDPASKAATAKANVTITD